MIVVSDEISVIKSKFACECDGCGSDVELGDLVMAAKGMNERIFICELCVMTTAAKIEECNNDGPI